MKKRLNKAKRIRCVNSLKQQSLRKPPYSFINI